MRPQPPSPAFERALLWAALFPLGELYVSVALAGVTHRDLLLQSRVALPLLRLAIPSGALAIAAPALLLALLVGALRQWRLFGGRLRGRAVRAAAWLALVGSPVLVLLQAQFIFLPAHSSTVTWLHRGFLVVGLALTWWGWTEPGREIRWRRRLALASRVLIVVTSCGLATFPGEWTDTNVGGARVIPRAWRIDAQADKWISASELLFGTYPGGGLLWGLVSNTLDLTGQSFVPPTFSAEELVGPSLRGRRLEKANFFLTDLRRADFRGAFLDGANFEQADVRGANFSATTMRDASFGNGAMEGADFSDANLEASYFNGTLPGLVFQRARLRGALFGFGVPTHLEGANLSGAELEGAVFGAVFLQGADLRGAKLSGASFDWAPFVKSWFDGANLDGASLQGVDFRGVSLAGASLRRARVWRSINEPRLDLADTTGIDRETRPSLDIEALRRVSEGNPLKQEQARRLAALNAASPEPPGTTPLDMWPSRAPATEALARFLADLACTLPDETPNGPERPYIARGLLANGRLLDTGRDIALVADRMKKAKDDPSVCPGVAGFDDKDWTALDAVVARASTGK